MQGPRPRSSEVWPGALDQRPRLRRRPRHTWDGGWLGTDRGQDARLRHTDLPLRNAGVQGSAREPGAGRPSLSPPGRSRAHENCGECGASRGPPITRPLGARLEERNRYVTPGTHLSLGVDRPSGNKEAGTGKGPSPPEFHAMLKRGRRLPSKPQPLRNGAGLVSSPQDGKAARHPSVPRGGGSEGTCLPRRLQHRHTARGGKRALPNPPPSSACTWCISQLRS